TFSSRTWKIDSEGVAGDAYVRETGFWRISAKDEIEMTYTSSNGIVEIFYGEVFNERAWQLQSASTMVTETGPKHLGPGQRMYGLMPNNNLGWVDERLVDDEMRPYMSAELRRVAGQGSFNHSLRVIAASMRLRISCSLSGAFNLCSPN